MYMFNEELESRKVRGLKNKMINGICSKCSPVYTENNRPLDIFVGILMKAPERQTEDWLCKQDYVWTVY